MNSLLVIINIIILLIMIWGLYILQKKHVKFSTRVFVGLGIGIIFGFLIHVVYGTTSDVTTTTISWFNIVGNGYVKFLQMVNTINKIPNLIFVIYPAGILLILVLVIYELPKMTYFEATEMIEKNTGEIVNDNKDKVKGQMGFYYIYTDQNTYIIDANTGEFTQKND